MLYTRLKDILANQIIILSLIYQVITLYIFKTMQYGHYPQWNAFTRGAPPEILKFFAITFIQLLGGGIS